jgi:hypothetical protein
MFTAKFERTSGSQVVKQRLNTLAAKAVYVGIPASSARVRQEKLLAMAGKLTGKSKSSKKKRATLEKSAARTITNAELLFIFSKGSPLRNQPARPVLEPAIEAEGNRQAIAAELSGVAMALLEGRNGDATAHLRRAGVAGANAARGWFTDPRNGWAQNAASTIRKKLGKLTGKRRRKALAILDSVSGFASMPMVGQFSALDAINTPGIDTGAMRQAITWVIKNDDTPTAKVDEHPIKIVADQTTRRHWTEKTVKADAPAQPVAETAGEATAEADVAAEAIAGVAETLGEAATLL